MANEGASWKIIAAISVRTGAVASLLVTPHPFANVPIVAAYTRKNAIDDGVLVDVSAFAGKLGFRHPVAIGENVWGCFIELDENPASHGQEPARLRDLLRRAFDAIQGAAADAESVKFEVPLPVTSRPATIKALAHGGDDGEPVITILFTSED